MAKTYSNRTRDKQEVKAITDQLEEGLKELFANEKYKSYLSMMSKFHNYSANNIQLIAMQCPDATFVAGKKAWENEFNRQVNGREEGIRILAPAPYTIKKEQDKVDPVTGEIMLDKDGMPEKEEIEIRIPPFVLCGCMTYRRQKGNRFRDWRQKNFCPRWRIMRILLRQSALLPRFPWALKIFPALQGDITDPQKSGLRCRRA